MVDATNNVDVTNNLARALIAAHGSQAALYTLMKQLVS